MPVAAAAAAAAAVEEARPGVWYACCRCAVPRQAWLGRRGWAGGLPGGVLLLPGVAYWDRGLTGRDVLTHRVPEFKAVRPLEAQL